MFHKVARILMAVTFLFSSVIPPTILQAGEMVTQVMPAPGTYVGLSTAFTPAQLMGISIHPDDPFRFDFIIDRGDEILSNEQKQVEYKKLVKYFLSSLTVPDAHQWVNLSPYEKDRLIEDDFGKTEMGRDLLAQDYLLKQLTASLIYPEKGLGHEFWDKVYARAYQQFGTVKVPVNTFNKVWIVPDEAQIYEKGNTAYVLQNHLKVMLEEDYLSLKNHSTSARTDSKSVGTLGSQVVREIILPALEKEVNEGKNFAMLRQVYSGMILAAWYKRELKGSLLSQIYVNKSKLKGVDQVDPKANGLIYQRYLQAFKKGVFNYIKQDTNIYTHQQIPRKYFSGGAEGFVHTRIGTVGGINPAQIARLERRYENADAASVTFTMAGWSLTEGQKAYLGTLARKVHQQFFPADIAFNYPPVGAGRLADFRMAMTAASLSIRNGGQSYKWSKTRAQYEALKSVFAGEPILIKGKPVLQDDFAVEYGDLTEAALNIDNEDVNANAKAVHDQFKAVMEAFSSSAIPMLDSPMPEQIYAKFTREAFRFKRPSPESNAEQLRIQYDALVYVFKMEIMKDNSSWAPWEFTGAASRIDPNLIKSESGRELVNNFLTHTKTLDNRERVDLVTAEDVGTKEDIIIARRRAVLAFAQYDALRVEMLGHVPGKVRELQYWFGMTTEAALGTNIYDPWLNGHMAAYMFDELRTVFGTDSGATWKTLANLVRATFLNFFTARALIDQGDHLNDAAMSPHVEDKDHLGGIDMNAANLNMQIKHDGKGVALPISQQDMAQFSSIQGLEPEILEIRPTSIFLFERDLNK